MVISGDEVDTEHKGAGGQKTKGNE